MKNSMKKLGKFLCTFTMIASLSIGLVGCDEQTNSDVNKQNTKVATAQTKENTRKKLKENSTLKVHYINVGQADSMLVQQDNHFMLIDAGNNDDSTLVVDYLKKQGVKKLDYVIGTHPHEDHIGGLDKVIDSFEIGQVLMPNKTSNTATYKDVITSIKNKNLKITSPVPDTIYKLGVAEWSIFAPAKNKDYESINNYSIVQKLKFGNTSFVFTGDAEAVSEMEMVKGGYDLQADVLKIGHHGSKTSTCQAFLDKVSPKYAVISCGKDNKYKHPNKSTMDRLKSKNIAVYRTDECGTIVATSDGEKVTFNVSPGSYDFRDMAEAELNKTAATVAPTIVPSNSAVTNSNNNSIIKNNTPAKKTQKKQNVSKPVKNSRQVWLSATGSKYHSRPNCGRMNPSRATKVSIEEAQSSGCGPCSKCM
ncbi:MBL fold metallo-hydrolase [Clostridium botulinum]|uniref:ComEC/Rec2 family competence protein n=1 Tax=Clostridium botulinum TaxID=1491 RepID=UPI00052BEC4C|nr:ComEC/Rec2 family competence protein [Clostridium botulinum]KGM92913.1 beta-lactamase [Clostridium botulinum D str. CCUG 7971]KOC49933.1 beta-lactamase [Clostridium botulinum]NFO98204.1 MBL fold metallo-hydrolase [Clostridium botulinum]OOV50725.1 MBL fold protein [Clostridium botulinum D/C]OOV53607.1 MBL fold protein [Clostridium botulinum D/C]